MRFRCPNCKHGIELEDETSFANTQDFVICPSCDSRFEFSSELVETVVPEEGRRIGHFEVRDILGGGAFGTVFSAFDTRLERLVAIKVPREGRFGSDSMRAFFKEARAAATVRHPNVIQVHEIGTHQDRPYIVTDLIDGISLSEWLKLNQPGPKQSALIMQQICEAVQAAHEHSVIHRDLKPSNVLIDASHAPHVGDFGLARRTGTTDLTVTRAGKVFGTPAYMSPEQARGDADNVNEASDIYSLGVSLYEMLTRERPFDATDSRTVMYRILTEEPTPPRKLNDQIPPDLETIWFVRDGEGSARRYPSAKAMAEDLARYLEDRPIVARPVSRLEHTWRWARRNQRLAAASAAVLVLACLTVLLAMRPAGDATLRMATQIECQLPDDVDAASHTANWTFARLNDERLPDESTVVQIQGGPLRVKQDLEPGEYLVVVEVPGVGFHEVYRLIPASSDLVSGTYTPTRFDFDGSTVVLPAVRIFHEQDVVQDMALIKGADYYAGREGNPFSPRTLFEIDDFYLQRSEVTFDAYTSVLPEPALYKTANPPPEKGKHPIVGVHFYQAAHYAEAIGCRLVSELEWEYAATNGGTTTVPWVGEHAPDPRWEFRPVGNPEFDITPLTQVRGLHTNAAEITSSVLHPYGTGEMPAAAWNQAKNGFVYKGGPYKLEAATQSANRSLLTDRKSLADRNLSGDYLTFRCGRSAVPEFVTNVD